MTGLKKMRWPSVVLVLASASSMGCGTDLAGAYLVDTSEPAEIGSEFCEGVSPVDGGRSPFESGCADVAKNFEACGGNLEGIWSWEKVCYMDLVVGEEYRVVENCHESRAIVRMDLDAYIAFSGGTFTMQLAQVTVTLELSFPLSCLPEGAKCVEFSGGEVFEDCTPNESDCLCTGSALATGEGESGTYKVDGNYVTMIGTDGAGSYFAFCTQGDYVVMKAQDTAEGEPSKVYSVFKRE